MSRRNPVLVEGQQPLFTMPAIGEYSEPIVTPWQELEGTPEEKLRAIVGDSIGPSVLIAHRAEHMVMAMDKLAAVNRLGGFAVAVNDLKYRDAIVGSYYEKGEMPKFRSIRKNSPKKAERLSREINGHLLQASGYFALKGTGWITWGEYRSRTAHDSKEMIGLWGTPTLKPGFNKLRDNQRKLLPKDHPRVYKPKARKKPAKPEAITV